MGGLFGSSPTDMAKVKRSVARNQMSKANDGFWAEKSQL